MLCACNHPVSVLVAPPTKKKHQVLLGVSTPPSIMSEPVNAENQYLGSPVKCIQPQPIVVCDSISAPSTLYCCTHQSTSSYQRHSTKITRSIPPVWLDLWRHWPVLQTGSVVMSGSWGGYITENTTEPTGWIISVNGLSIIRRTNVISCWITKRFPTWLNMDGSQRTYSRACCRAVSGVIM